MDLRVAILHGVLYMSKGWENAHGNLKFGKSRFLTRPRGLAILWIIPTGGGAGD